MVTQYTSVSSHNSPYGSSILDRQGICGREHDDPMDDLDVNMAICGIFLNATLRAADYLGQDHEANLRYVKNNLWNSVGLLFHETGKLISEQKEITGVRTMEIQRCYVGNESNSIIRNGLIPGGKKSQGEEDKWYSSLQ